MSPEAIVEVIAKLGKFAKTPATFVLGELLHQTRKKKAFKGLEYAFSEKNTAEKNRIARCSAQNQIKGLFDFLNMERTQCQFHGIEHLTGSDSQVAKGGIVLSLHLGIADASTWLLNQHNIPAKTVIGAGKEGKRKETEWVAAIMRHSGCPFIKRDKGFFVNAINELNAGNHLIFHCDMNSAGESATFFNFETEIPVLGLKLAQLSNLPIYFSYGYYIGKVYHQVIEPYESCDTVSDAQALAQKMEQVIIKHPDAWIWQYNRWK